MSGEPTKVLFLSTYIPGDGPPSRYLTLFSKLESDYGYDIEVRTRVGLARFVTASFDVVMGSDPATFARAWLLGRRYGVPVLYDFRDPYLDFYDRVVFAKSLLKLLKNRPRAILTSMKYYIDEYGLPRSKSVYAPNAAPFEWTTFQGSPIHNQICYAGKLNRAYNLNLAIRAVDRLTDEFPGITLKIAGDGPRREHLERLADDLNVADHVEFLGLVAHDELKSLFLASEVGLALNPWVGKKEFEYLACGLPCLANERRATEEQIDPLYTVPATTDGVTHGLGYLLENGDVRERLGTDGRNQVREFFNWDKQAEIWHQAIEDSL